MDDMRTLPHRWPAPDDDADAATAEPPVVGPPANETVHGSEAPAASSASSWPHPVELVDSPADVVATAPAEGARPAASPRAEPVAADPETRRSAPEGSDTTALFSAAGAAAAAARARRNPTVVRRLAGLAVLAAIAGAAGGVVGAALDDGIPTSPVAATASTDGDAGIARAALLAGEPLDVAGVVDAVSPAVVRIQSDVAGPFGARGSGAGTGVVISADGEVLTNAHVVEGATTINVTLAGESQSRTATVVGADTGADLALLRIDDAERVPVAELGSSDALEVGDDVVAIGNALALRGGPTVTRGIVSALDRSLDTGSGTMTGLVQTDASISSGNSGGPLVNRAGEVVGINTAVATSGAGTAAENVGFAIAIDRALPVVERLRDGTEAVEPGVLGVGIGDPTDGSRGAVVLSVEDASPADDAGIEQGDLITAVAGTPVDGAAALAAAVGEHEPGDEVAVAITRDGDEREVEVTLAARTGA
jgi:S1-C subfamily serine protease